MAITSNAAADMGNMPHVGREKSVSVKIEKKPDTAQTQSIKLDLDTEDRKSIKLKPAASARQSIASLVNEDKGHIGKKIDISV